MLDFDALFEVARVDSRGGLLAAVRYVSECNDTYVALGGGLEVAIILYFFLDCGCSVGGGGLARA